MADETTPRTAPQPAPAGSEEEAKKAELRARKHKRRVRAVRSIILRLVVLFLVVYVLFFHLVGLTIMPTGDMYPRIDAGDLVLFYRLESTVRAQDIVVFEKPTAVLQESYEEDMAVEQPTVNRDKPFFRRALDWLGFRDPADPPMTRFICRVVAAPGDTVEISENETLLVNGNVMIENNIFYSTPLYGGFVEYPLKLGENEFFVLADHRTGGADSRFFGIVTKDEIEGTVITILRRNNL